MNLDQFAVTVQRDRENARALRTARLDQDSATTSTPEKTPQRPATTANC